jgi:alpha-mannosidase
VPTETGPPRTGVTGWFFHVDSRNVQLTRILGVYDSGRDAAPLEQHEHSTVPSDPGFAVRLMETEGIAKQVKLRCFRRPTFARKCDFRGQTISDLLIEGDAVMIDMTAFEVIDVELRFNK